MGPWVYWVPETVCEWLGLNMECFVLFHLVGLGSAAWNTLQLFSAFDVTIQDCRDPAKLFCIHLKSLDSLPFTDATIMEGEAHGRQNSEQLRVSPPAQTPCVV